MPKTLSLFAALLFPAAAAATGMGVEDTPLRPSEIKLMQRIAAVDPEFGDLVEQLNQRRSRLAEQLDLTQSEHEP